jgi:hypothetical protein
VARQTVCPALAEETADAKVLGVALRVHVDDGVGVGVGTGVVVGAGVGVGVVDGRGVAVAVGDGDEVAGVNVPLHVPTRWTPLMVTVHGTLLMDRGDAVDAGVAVGVDVVALAYIDAGELAYVAPGVHVAGNVVSDPDALFCAAPPPLLTSRKLI